MILTHIPPIQRFIGTQVGNALGDKLGTQVTIGRVDLGLFNRFIIDDISILDQQGCKMISAGRVSAKFDYLPLTEGKISISSAQLFGLQAHFYKSTAQAKANYQFVLDSLASKDTTSHKPLDLSIRSLIIRNGQVRYDQNDIAKASTFSTKHLNISNLSTHIMLNAIRDDSVNISVKKFSAQEQSGLALRALTFNLIAGSTGARLSQFEAQLPHSTLRIPSIVVSYRRVGGKIEPATVQFDGSIDHTDIAPSDLACFVPTLRPLTHPVGIKTTFRGTSTSLRVSDLQIRYRAKTIVAANGSITDWNATPRWAADIQRITFSATDIEDIAQAIKNRFLLPAVVHRLGDIHYQGHIGGKGKDIALKGVLATSAGKINLFAGKSGSAFNGEITTHGLNLGLIADNALLGNIATSLYLKGTQTHGKMTSLLAQGTISGIDYNHYTYKNITIDGQYARSTFRGTASLNDPNGLADIEGSIDLASTPVTNITAKIRRFSPAGLRLTSRWGAATFDADIQANIKGRSINDALGHLDISNLLMTNKESEYRLASLTLNASNSGSHRVMVMDSDFGHMSVSGRYDYATLVQSLTNIVGSKLPTLPGLPRTTKAIHNDFAINAVINKSDWLNHLFGIPLELKRPFALKGNVNDQLRQIEMTLNMPMFEYNGSQYERGYIRLTSPNDTLKAYAHLKQVAQGGQGTYWNIKAQAAHNKLRTLLSFENNGKNSFAGMLDTEAQFYKNQHGLATAHVNVLPSNVTIGDSVWNVRPATVSYYKDHVAINQLAIEHNKQHIIISGNATPNSNDTIKVDLQDVDVSYILNLVNFHSVEFSGKATGYAYISAPFAKPEARADLWVRDFRFEDGRMGILSANVNLNRQKEQIDIDATAYDDDDARTYIKGYVSPARNYIDLRIRANNTRGEFLESFCSSFMKDVNLQTNGNIRVYGDLKEVNLEGDAVVNGTVNIKPLNATYTLENCPIKMVPNEIKLQGDAIRDRNGNYGTVNGSLYHKHLTKLSYDIGVKAHNLLAYDFRDYGDNTFYGTVFATGDCRIQGKSGEVRIDANLTPEKGSFIEYNAASPDAISNQSFIHWTDRDSTALASASADIPADSMDNALIDIPSDIHMNLLINCTPDATLRVLMDKRSGDYIALNGNGTIRATYFNKGDFDMFGTYEVDHGIYKLTIQNIIRRDFQFLPGGTIGFGGNAMDAVLNLKAQYAVNGVSLSDLSIGRSFTSNNIRVNCLMNISGTPNAPKVDFGLDLPTVSADAKQMITSLINSEEGMNQQVLYLLAVGRFYSQNNNSAAQNSSQQPSQTSLAMQSILSGTLSQQLNSLIGSVTKNDHWNFGANISTGDEGWNNAEYEGLLSGRMLNNRLLFNGQFGYRDKANATTSFIGDFDLQYLIYPNGNFAVRVYNQTNDRYFTKNSLNTQGIGLILKKDFNGFRDLFNFNKNKKKKARKQRKATTGKNK